MCHRSDQIFFSFLFFFSFNIQTSRQLHDAALASVTLPHLPPIRLSCIRGLVAPSYQGPCLHPDCNLTGCEGNRLYIMSTSPLLMRIQLPHHKNACKWGQASIEFDLPAELAELLYTYLGEPCRALLDHHLLIGQNCPYVFMNMHGRGFERGKRCDMQFHTRLAQNILEPACSFGG
ncbi:TPA: hypothetical protein ACH3X3_003292 [Trebouxia sp. C0006]